ncbi:hypothetical protein PIB30_092941, partial [Stylosanthes scabra]|nr:hypothetical protein [Stylosanthes scabra]
ELGSRHSSTCTDHRVVDPTWGNARGSYNVRRAVRTTRGSFPTWSWKPPSINCNVQSFGGRSIKYDSKVISPGTLPNLFQKGKLADDRALDSSRSGRLGS